MATTVKALENSIYWQRQVLTQSRDPAQKARAQVAIERLQAQIDAIHAAQQANADPRQLSLNFN